MHGVTTARLRHSDYFRGGRSDIHGRGSGRGSGGADETLPRRARGGDLGWLEVGKNPFLLLRLPRRCFHLVFALIEVRGGQRWTIRLLTG